MANFTDWPVHSLLAQFRPELGWELDRACFAAYSADIRVVTATLLALAGHASEPELGSRVQLVQALRKLRGRVAFVVQRGRIHWPRSLPNVAALLDRFLFEADCDERYRSWHPKLALMRWCRPGDQAVAWRAWLGSRNLTRDLSRDAGLLLVQATDSASGIPLPELTRAAKALQSHLPEGAKPFNGADLNALTAVRWAAPMGVETIQLHWLDGTQAVSPATTGQRRVIIVSPFVDAESMEAASTWMERGRPVIVAAEPELVREAGPELEKKVELLTFPVAPEEGAAYEPALSGANVDAGDSERELDRSDETGAYHAKLIYLRSRGEKCLWMGSANFTQRAWGRNYEVVAKLTATGRDPWAAVLEDLVQNANRFESPAEQPRRKNDLAEDLRKALCVGLQCSQLREGGSVMLIATQWPATPDAEIELRVGQPFVDRAPVAWAWGSERVSLGEVKLEECSELMLFVLSHGDEEVGWVMHVPFRPPLEGDRDRAAIASYLGPDGYLRLIAEELEPAKGGAPPWDAPKSPPGRHRTAIGLHRGLPTLEGLLRLSLREPARLKAIAETVALMEQEAEKWRLDEALNQEQREALDGFRRLWDEVGVPLMAKLNGSDT